MGSRPLQEIEASGQLVQNGAQILKIAQHPERSDTNSVGSPKVEHNNNGFKDQENETRVL